MNLMKSKLKPKIGEFRMSQHHKGSSHDLLVWTNKQRSEMAAQLNRLFNPLYVNFSEQDEWVPDEQRGQNTERSIKTFVLKHKVLFPNADMKRLESWWQEVPLHTVWDFISTCTYQKEPKGLLIVEAKAHKNELKKDGKKITFQGKNYHYDQALMIREGLQEKEVPNRKLLKSINDKLCNHESIERFLCRAGKSLSDWIPDNNIDISKCYQLGNRIATTWMLASCGIPTSLVYLGFVNDPYEADKKPIVDSADWRRTVSEYFANVGASALLEPASLILENGCSMHFCSTALDLSIQQD